MIYFIRCSLTRRVKIGYADDPWKRLSKIQSDSPADVSIVALEEGDVSREGELHAQFADCRVRGEWFDPKPALLEYIVRLGEPVRPTKNLKSRSFWGGMTDAEVHRITQVARSTLSSIRAGTRRPSVEMALALQRATGRSAVELLFGDDTDEAIAGITKRRAA